MSRWRDRLVIALATVVLVATLVSAQPFSRPGGPGLVVAGGGGGVTAGTASANQCAYWTSGSAIAGDADCTFDGTTFAVTTLTVGTGHATPATNDGSQLGTTLLQWSDLFLASGAVINFGNGEVTLTSAADTVTVAGGQWVTVNGTAALPGLGVGGTGNGLFWDGSSFMGLSTAGVVRAYVSANVFRPATADTEVLGGQTVGWGGLWLGPSSGAVRLTGTSTAGTVVVSDGNNGKAVNIGQATELTTIAAAATTDTTIQIPANSLVIAVTVRVTVVIPTAATFDIGVAGATTRYGTGISTAANTTNSSPGTTNPTIYASAVKITFTPNLTPLDATGRVRTTIYYIDATVPTS